MLLLSSPTVELEPGSMGLDWYAMRLIKLRDDFNKRWKQEPELFSCMMDLQKVLIDMMDNIKANAIKKRINKFTLE